MCCIDKRRRRREDGEGEVEWKCARQRYNLRAFHFTGHRCVEKFMTGFRIDGRTIKEGQTCLHIGHLVPLERSNIVMLLGSSRVARSSKNSLKIIVKMLTHMHIGYI